MPDEKWTGQTLSAIVTDHGERGGSTGAPVTNVEQEDASYTGPLDLVSGVVAYGVRALSAAMLGEPIFRLMRSGDSAESDFSADAVTGDAPVAAITAWINAGGGTQEGTLVTLYDQSGNGKHGTSGSGTWTANAGNGKCGFTNAVVVCATLSFSSRFSFFYVADGTVGFSFTRGYVTYGGSVEISIENTTDPGSNYAYAAYPANSAGIHVTDGLCKAGAHEYVLDGSPVTADATDDAGTVTSSEGEGALVLGVDKFQECIFSSSDLNTAARAPARQNIETYYA